MISVKQMREIQARNPQYIDLCFLLDITSSMKTWMDSAKSVISKVLKEVASKNQEVKTIRYAFVGYADIDDKVPFVIHPFTDQVEVIEKAIADCPLMYGYDIAEDVAGGLQKVVDLDWNSFTRVLIHIADAPGHGSFMHSLANSDDNFLNAPEKPVIDLMEKLVTKKIDYFFMEIHNCTTKMTNYFKTKMDSFNAPNMEPKVSITLLKGIISQNTSTPPDVQNLLFLQKITEAILTAHTSSLLRSTKAKEMIKKTNVLDENWHKLKDAKTPRKGKVLSYALHSYDKTLEEIIEFFLSGKPPVSFCTDINIIIDEELLAHGAQRNAYRALDTDFDVKLVAKSFIEPLTIDEKIEEYQQVVRAHFVAKELGKIFNTHKEAVKFGIHFVDIKMLIFENSDGEIVECYSLEPFIEGEYQKYFSNSGEVPCIAAAIQSPEVMALFQTSQTFSHWTYEITKQNLIVTDIQGVKYRMTDPAISSVGQLYGETDTGEEGFKDFFEAHYCNELCLKLGLKHPNGDLYMEHPSLPKTISNTIDHVDFCSGYCCGNYIEYKIGEKTPDGTLFCNKCNQRNSITEKKVCKKKGCSLKFEIERWYWVSTGKHPPTKCHLHRGTIASELRDWKKNKTLPNGALFTQEEMQNQLDKDPDLKKQFEKSIIQEKKPDLFNTVVISNLPARTNSMDIFNMLPPFFTNRNQKVKVTELEVPSTFSIEFENEPIALEAYQILGSYIHRRRLIVCRPLQHKHESVKLDKSSINIQLSKYPNVKCSDILQYFKDSNYKIQDKYYEENKFANFTFSDPSIAPTLVSKGLSIDGTLVKVVYKKEKPITKQDVPLKNFKEKKIEIDENVDKTSVHIKWRPKNPSESVQLQEIDLLKLLNQSDIFKKKFNSAKSFMQITFKSEQSAALLIKNGLKLPNFKFTINFKKIQENERSNDCNEKRVQSEAKSKKEKQYPKVVANSLTPTSDSTTKNLKSNISTSNNQSPKQQNISKMQNLMFVFDINTLLKIGNLRNLLGQFLENHIQFCVPDIKLDEMNEDTFAVQNLVDEFKEINVQVPDESNNLTLRTLKVTKKVSDNYPNRNVMLVTDDKELKANADKFRLNVINSSAMNQLIRQSSVNNSVPKPIPSISNPSQKSTTIPTTNTVETIIIEPSNQRTTNTPVPVPVLQSMTKLISHGKRK